jgi:hypothetical protein
MNFKEYLEMSIGQQASGWQTAKQVGQQIGNAVVGASPIGNVVGVAQAGAGIVRSIFGFIKNNQRDQAINNIVKAMQTPDGHRPPDDCLDLNDNISSILNQNSIKAIAQQILIQLQAYQKQNRMPNKDFANNVAKQYIRKMVGI